MEQKMKEAINTLLDTGNKAIITFTKKDLLGEEVNIEELLTLPRLNKILKKQQPNGSWIYPNKKAILRSPTNYNQYQAYKTVAELVEFYGLNKNMKQSGKQPSTYFHSRQRKENSGECMVTSTALIIVQVSLNF